MKRELINEKCEMTNCRGAYYQTVEKVGILSGNAKSVILESAAGPPAAGNPEKTKCYWIPDLVRYDLSVRFRPFSAAF